MLKSGRRRHWLAAGLGSVAVHLGVLAVVLLVRPPIAPFEPPAPPTDPVEVTLFRPPPGFQHSAIRVPYSHTPSGLSR